MQCEIGGMASKKNAIPRHFWANRQRLEEHVLVLHDGIVSYNNPTGRADQSAVGGIGAINRPLQVFHPNRHHHKTRMNRLLCQYLQISLPKEVLNSIAI